MIIVKIIIQARPRRYGGPILYKPRVHVTERDARKNETKIPVIQFSFEYRRIRIVSTRACLS